MKLSGIYAHAPAPAELVADLRLGRGRYPWTIGLAALAAIAIQCLLVPIDADVSWLLTVCDRVLSGDRLYVDIIEVNPPASVWLYLPLVWIAKLAGIKAEAAVAGAFVMGGIASVVATLRLTARFEDFEQPRLSGENTRTVIKAFSKEIDLSFIDQANRFRPHFIRCGCQLLCVALRSQADNLHPLRNIPRDFQRAFPD